MAVHLGAAGRAVAGWREPLSLGAVPGRAEPDEALPGMANLVSAVAGRTIGPGRLLRHIGREIAELEGLT